MATILAMQSMEHTVPTKAFPCVSIITTWDCW